MSESAPKASLATLPPEVLRLIFPDPVNYTEPDSVEPALTPEQFDRSYENRWLPVHEYDSRDQIRIDDSHPYRQKWLPITNKKFYAKHPDTDPNELRTLLRSLTQTCRSLRAFAPPLLWAVVHVSTVEELGRIRETLKVSPEIASLIRSFVFSWDMDEGYQVYEHYDAAEGSLLDLAFRNRTKMWNDLRKQHGCKLKNNYAEAYEPCSAYRWFVHNKVEFMEPGQMPPRKGCDPNDEVAWDDRKPRIGANGPDGKGKDRFIKDPKDFNSCMDQIAAQLTSLETFGWCSSLAQIPTASFNTLAKLPTLTTLHVTMSEYRGDVHFLPLWKLTSKLKSLSFSCGSPEYYEREEAIVEQLEETYASFELPSERPTPPKARHSLHKKIAIRMVIDAAKGGRLRTIEGGLEIQAPFAMRSLLPCWVGVEQWGISDGVWADAALSLRPTLGHASLWLGTESSSGVRKDRTLTTQEVQGLSQYFKTEPVPELVSGTREDETQPIERYLPWLEEEKLAKRVADAWSVVVREGKADMIRCRCKKCRTAGSS